MTGKKKPLVDQAVRDTAAHDLTRSFCVEAGAGTGKTTLLVDRFLSIVRSGRARCSRIVAITFTEKAAGEMKVRLRLEIGKLLDSDALGGDERERLAAARDELERAPISTIHAFAASILREYPMEAGLDPGYVQLDAAENSIFIDECQSEFLTHIPAPYDSVVKRFIIHGGSIERIREIMLQLYERRGDGMVGGDFGALCGAGGSGVHEGVAGSAGVPDGGGSVDGNAGVAGSATSGESGVNSPPSRPRNLHALRDEIRRGIRAMSDLADRHCINADDRGCMEIGRFRAGAAVLDSLAGEELEDFLLLAALPKPRGSKKNWNPPETCTEQKEWAARLIAAQEECRKAFTDAMRDELVRWLVRFIDFARRRKAEDAVLDFDDLLIRTRELLRDAPTLAALRKRYQYILVDEFQDTDPLQAEIVLLLSGGDEADCFHSEPGKLFIVGDPKQSIYRFRKADVEIYERVKERLAESGSHVRIMQNFRSVPGVIEWVNSAFAHIIRKPVEGRYQPVYEPIVPRRKNGKGAVVCLDLEIGDGKPRVDDLRMREGEAIARVIHRIMGEGLMVMDSRKRTLRPVKYGDIAVIYPGTTGIDYYEDPLRSEKIPYIVEGGKLYYTRQEIRDLAAALWAVEDPWDSLSLVAALRSPIFGFSDEEIFLYTRAGGRLSYMAPGVPEGRTFGDLAAAFELLADLHRLRSERGPAGTLTELLKRTNYLELSLLRPHGEQRVLNIRKAIQNARSFEGGLGSYRRFARWFRDQDVLGAAEGESPLVDEDEEAVRLLTIHKSKGLQFPVVILANLMQRRRRYSKILLERGSRLGFKLGPWMETSDFAALEDNEQKRDEAETARLLYVSCTRAGDLLVIPRTPMKASYFEIIADYLPGAGSGEPETGGVRTEPDATSAETAAAEGASARGVSLWRLSDLPPLRGVPQPFVRLPAVNAGERRRAVDAKSEWMSERTERIRRASAAPAIITPSMIEDLKSRRTREKTPASSGASTAGGASAAVEPPAHDDLMLFPGFGEGAASSPGDAQDITLRDEAFRFGSAFHRLMEIIDLNDESTIAAAARIVAAEFGVDEAAGELESLARKAFSSELLRSAARASGVYREVPFTVPFRLDGEEGVHGDEPCTHFMEGRMDLLFEAAGCWTVVDYKTDDVAGDRIEQRFQGYRSQGIIYAAAVQRLGIELKGGVVFYFVRPDVMRTLAVTAEIIRETDDLVRSTAGSAFGAVERQ